MREPILAPRQITQLERSRTQVPLGGSLVVIQRTAPWSVNTRRSRSFSHGTLGLVFLYPEGAAVETGHRNYKTQKALR